MNAQSKIDEKCDNNDLIPMELVLTLDLGITAMWLYVKE